MINSLPCPPPGGHSAEADSVLPRNIRAAMPGNDCPWLASDPQLLAAATADHHREKQQDQFEDSPLGGDEHTRIANEMVWLVRRGG